MPTGRPRGRPKKDPGHKADKSSPIETPEVEEEKAEEIENLDEVFMEEGAKAIVRRLPPHAQHWFEQVSGSILKLPYWRIILGNLWRSVEQGELHTFPRSWVIEKSYDMSKPLVCEECGKEFEPLKPRQRFCSNTCGCASMRTVEVG